MPKRGPTQVDSTRVYKVLRDNPGMIYHYRDLAEQLGYPETNVSTLLARAISKHPDYGFRRVGESRSGQYVYRNEYALEQPPETVEAPSAKLYEVVGFMPDNATMVVRDDDNAMSLWRKVEIN